MPLKNLFGLLSLETTQADVKTAAESIEAKVATETTLAQLKTVSDNIKTASDNILLAVGAIKTAVEDLNTKTIIADTNNISGAVLVGNFPTTQAIAGTVNVNNFPATQPISGNVNVSNFPTDNGLTDAQLRATAVDVEVNNLSEIVTEIQVKDLMIAVKNLLTIITNPTWLDMTANRLNVQAILQSGTVTTVSTLTNAANLTNIDSYPGRMLIMTNELNAWANTVRRTIV